MLTCVWLMLACACDSYDPRKLPEVLPPTELPRIDSGQHEPPGDVTTEPDAGPDATTPPPPSNDAGTDAGRDAGPPDASVGCELNPAPDAGSCPEICSEVCNGEDDDCDGEIDGADADRRCAAPHADALCLSGKCRIAECKNGYRDCDGKPGNGCEIAPDDVENCGTCGKVCKLQNAMAACEDGQCVAIGCAAGYGDCDEDRKSCELSTHTLTDCGECGVPCGELPNATPQCDSGSCDVDQCLGLFGNCNGMAMDGCEQKLDTLADCGQCDMPCTKASCAGGVCTAVLCSSPMADCNRDEIDCEVDTSSSIDHCGGCDLPCAFGSGTPHATLDCQSSACVAVCDADYGDCDDDYQNGCEAPLLTTAAHCNGCGNDCATLLPHVATGSCSAGTCGVSTCDSGWENCDGDPANGCERDALALGPCRPDTNCTRVVNGTHEYNFCTNARTRDDARARCRMQVRGDLVHIDDATENAFIDANRTVDSWIGGDDGQREGTFRWLDDGVPFWKGGAVAGRYVNFGASQPDDYNNGEDCLEMWSGGTWNDQACSATRGFVCEVRPDDCTGDNTKIAPGQCGCGSPDTDADADGFAVCADACESDASKQAPGACGCGTADTDSDGDATPNCSDGCDADPTQTVACLGFTPVNYDPNTVNWSTQPSTTLDCGTTTVNTTDPDGTGPMVATLTNWCGTAPTPITQTQSSGPELVILPLKGLTIAASNNLRVLGNRPLVLAVDGTVSVAGTIDASASGQTAGGGGNWSCGTSAGGNATGGSCSGGSEGGGGGGFGSAGGRGGDGGGSNTIGAAGAARGGSSISPLYGGCNGGLGGGNGTDAPGGGGGGAVQVIASGSITVTGTVRANGGGGSNGTCGNEAGGGGGGSGGAIFFESVTVTTTGATITVNGGNGGVSGSGASGGTGSTASGSAGGQGQNDGANGGGGGGGGYGRIRTLIH